ncbi:unnamed protein product [Vitrella brassicaformis CCMP3155]|uniref:Uncharacterized protein n=1 Tax=Vitrella brassicaformis (strain CCMP3155) TaxID=1169540 RepID=A0A0G4GV60_VITBC|nr:unnamed protein product [Vitrella brassicaformis CCMP3155]|mmetsp:Transcript_47194/g.117751  ORF Transcript_47194/g.117751 Transcript_47194/m.117751 type:complete len:150 (-) Transcript_47194:619-1068(-)|eukprot:CEM34784.1 unnamed protein product [Vitrella brassicaformis CCMP3155]
MGNKCSSFNCCCPPVAKEGEIQIGKAEKVQPALVTEPTTANNSGGVVQGRKKSVKDSRWISDIKAIAELEEVDIFDSEEAHDMVEKIKKELAEGRTVHVDYQPLPTARKSIIKYKFQSGEEGEIDVPLQLDEPAREDDQGGEGGEVVQQ